MYRMRTLEFSTSPLTRAWPVTTWWRPGYHTANGSAIKVTTSLLIKEIGEWLTWKFLFQGAEFKKKIWITVSRVHRIPRKFTKRWIYNSGIESLFRQQQHGEWFVWLTLNSSWPAFWPFLAFVPWPFRFYFENFSEFTAQNVIHHGITVVPFHSWSSPSILCILPVEGN